MAKLHYNKDALHQEYKKTFDIILKIGAGCLAFVLLYFMALAVYLGGWGHTPYTDFQNTFSDRIDIEYDGLKLTDDAPAKEHH